MCAHPDALVSSNDAGAAARQAAAPALPALPQLPLPAVPADGSGRKTAAPAPAWCPCIGTSRVPIPRPRAPHRDTATTRTDTRYPKPHAPHDNPVGGSGFPAHDPDFANRGSSNYQLDRNPKMQTFSRDHDSLFEWPETTRNEGNVGASEKTKKRRRFGGCEKQNDQEPDASVRADSPTPLTRQNALDSSTSRAMHFGSLLDLLEGAPESLEDDGGHARRDDDKIGLTVSLGESMNKNAARMLDFDESNMLLGESNQAFSNQQHDNAVSLFTDEGDGIDSFGIDSLVAHERCPVQNLVSGAVGDFFGSDVEFECARACQAPRITPPTPGRNVVPECHQVRKKAVDFSVPQEALRVPSYTQTVRANPAVTTSRGRSIAPPAFTEAHFVPKERRALWTGHSGVLPSAREVMRVDEQMAEVHTKIGVPVF